MQKPVSDFIKNLRSDLQMTQAQFSTKFGLNIFSLRQWEQGRCKPDDAAMTFLHVIAHSPQMVEAAILSKRAM